MARPNSSTIIRENYVAKEKENSRMQLLRVFRKTWGAILDHSIDLAVNIPARRLRLLFLLIFSRAPQARIQNNGRQEHNTS